ncbi:uncharacterized protein LOC124437977 [Xenia sp. Carnegie-2017]|uniref:uncharacterized protein LOC124437977 n=1 Tax=Xenia sp. Carnegie-2017 TaxID=2897299 RepID=UPI001F03B1F8|nr:uncharacterized protein LOC124437977 [Xenia sp. Carnegie-2017]
MRENTLDEIDSGANKGEVEYNVKTDKVHILGLKDHGSVEESKVGHRNRLQMSHETLQNAGVSANQTREAKDSRVDDAIRVSHENRGYNVGRVANEYRVVEEWKSSSEFHENRKKESGNFNVDDKYGEYVKLKANAPLRTERLQPINFSSKETAAMTSRSMASHDNRSRNMMPSDSVRNYTNMGYSQYGDDVSSVDYQQPVVVVRTFDHPGKSNYYRQRRSLPRNHSRLNFKKSSTTPRQKPLPSAWTINLRTLPSSYENYEEMKVCETESHGFANGRSYIVENCPKMLKPRLIRRLLHQK